MPIFEYTCQKCGMNFEKLILKQNYGAIPCPACGSKRTEQQFSSFATAGSPGKSSGGVCAPSGGG
jgi:putative FmdB family regulatory protein